jgi:hypothetical protein
VDRRSDEVLLSPWGCPRVAGVGRLDLVSERIIRVGEDGAGLAHVAQRVDRGLLPGVQRDVVLAVEVEHSFEQLHDHRSVGLDHDLELRASYGGGRRLAGDFEAGSADQVLDVSEGPADLLKDRDVLKIPALREVS